MFLQQLFDILQFTDLIDTTFRSNNNFDCLNKNSYVPII